MLLDPIERLEPADGALLTLACQHVDNSMLREIAEADYGMDDKAHLASLRQIKSGGTLIPLDWWPREVLELIRWSEPADPTWKPGALGTRGHWMRLFACTILIRAGAEPGNGGSFLGEDSTIIQLVDSAMRLGHETTVAAMRFLAWRFKTRPLYEEDRSYYAVALLLLSASINAYDPELLDLAINCTLSDESPIADLFRQSQKSEVWRSITNRLLVEPRATLSAEGLAEFSEFGVALIGDDGNAGRDRV
jgi:hypothetical protein